jgi:hypothetical protein
MLVVECVAGMTAVIMHSVLLTIDAWLWRERVEQAGQVYVAVSNCDTWMVEREACEVGSNGWG